MARPLRIELEGDRALRNQRIYEAFRVHGYTLLQLQGYLGLHYSTISRIAKGADEERRSKNKTRPLCRPLCRQSYFSMKNRLPSGSEMALVMRGRGNDELAPSKELHRNGGKPCDSASEATEAAHGAPRRLSRAFGACSLVGRPHSQTASPFRNLLRWANWRIGLFRL